MRVNKHTQVTLCFSACARSALTRRRPPPLLWLAGIDGNRTNLSQVHAIEVKSTASDDAFFLLQDDKVAHVFADFRQRARQKRAVAGVGRDESVNLLGIGKDRFTRAHGPPCAPGRSRLFFFVRALLRDLCILV